MIIKVYEESIECAKALQYNDGIHLLDSDNNIILIIQNPSLIQGVDGGEIEIIAYRPSVQEQLDAQAAAIMELMEVVLNG